MRLRRVGWLITFVPVERAVAATTLPAIRNRGADKSRGAAKSYCRGEVPGASSKRPSASSANSQSLPIPDEGGVNR